MKTAIGDMSFLALQLTHKGNIPLFSDSQSDVRPESQCEEELITLDNQEVENINELTFLDSKLSLFKI